MQVKIFVGIIIILSLILLWFIYVGNNADYLLNLNKDLHSFKKRYKYFKSPNDLYVDTIGYNLDDDAQLALRKANKREIKYKKQERDKTLNDHKTAADNSFIIAEVNRFNILPNIETLDENNIEIQNVILNHYNRAVQRLRFADTGNNEAPPAEFIINRAEDYWNEIDRNDIPRPRFNNIRDKVRRNKTRNIRQKTDKARNQKTYYNKKQIHNDPQNVHESQATFDLMNKYKNIVHLNNDNSEPYTLTDIAKFMENYKFRNSDHRARALTAFNFIKAGNEISKLNTTEDRILLHVWKRIHDPENNSRKSDLLTSLMDNLTDCVEIKNNVHKEVCAGGRTARVLNSLILLDVDENVSAPIKTAEILKNEIFTKTHKLIMDELKNTDEETRRGYNGEGEYTDKVAAFENHLRAEIEKNIRTTYTNIEGRILDNLIKDAQAGV